MDWVHCNTCFTLPNDSQNKFRLSSCGHIFCENCLQKESNNKCKTCGQIYTGTIVLSSEMKPDVQIYFTDVKEICKTAIKEIQQAQQVSEFQKGHTQRLAMFRKHQLGKATELINQARELDRKYRLVLKENEQLKNFLKSQGFQLKDALFGFDGSVNSMTPRTPKTPQASMTPSLLRTLSSNSMISSSSQKIASPRSAHLPYRSPGLTIQPSPMRMHSSPVTSNRPSPLGSHQRSPNINSKSVGQIQRNSVNMVAPNGRISIRTPPINGKLGPINSSPCGSSPRNYSTPGSTPYRLHQPIKPNTPGNCLSSADQSSTAQHGNTSRSKISQNLNAKRSSNFSSPSSPNVSTKVFAKEQNIHRDERRPIQLQNIRPVLAARSSFGSKP